MTAPTPPSERPNPKRSDWARRLVGAFVVSFLVFALLWFMVFTAVTAALVSAGVGGVLLVGSATSEVFETVLDALAEIVHSVFAAIAAVFAAILSIFN